MSDVPTVHHRMARVVAALSYIPKERSKGVSYEFRGIDAVMGALHGPLAENGLYLAPRVLDDWQVNAIPGKDNRTQHQALFRVCVDVWAEDGSSVTLGPGLAQSHDYGDKAVYQAQQNAIKYLLLEAFCIPTAEQDMDAREADPSPTVDLTAVNAAIVDALAVGLEVDTDKVRTHAQQGAEQAEQAERVLRDRIAAQSAPPDICDVCGEPEDGHSHEAPASEAEPSGEDARHSPDTPAWRQLAEAEGVTDQQLLIALNMKGVWPNSDQSAKPTRSEDLDRRADRHEGLYERTILKVAEQKRQKVAADA